MTSTEKKCPRCQKNPAYNVEQTADEGEILRVCEECEELGFVTCAYCPNVLPFTETYSPGDEAICPPCDTEITGRSHQGWEERVKKATAKLLKKKGG